MAIAKGQSMSTSTGVFVWEYASLLFTRSGPMGVSILLEEVKVVDQFDIDAPKTSEMVGILEALGVDRTCLVALGTTDRDAALSARNIQNVDTIRVDQLNAFDILNHRYLVLERASLESFIDGSCFATASSDEKEVA